MAELGIVCFTFTKDTDVENTVGEIALRHRGLVKVGTLCDAVANLAANKFGAGEIAVAKIATDELAGGKIHSFEIRTRQIQPVDRTTSERIVLYRDDPLTCLFVLDFKHTRSPNTKNFSDTTNPTETRVI